MNVKLKKTDSNSKFNLVIEPSNECCFSPFDLFEGENIEFIAWHRRYNLGNISSDMTPTEFEKLHSGKVIRKVWMYDHTWQTLSLTPFNDPWDSGFLGLIAADNEEQIARFIDCYNRYLHNEVYDLFVEETVYCHHCQHEHTDIIESIGGFWEDPEDILKEFLEEFPEYQVA